jgi:hypothetical protein
METTDEGRALIRVYGEAQSEPWIKIKFQSGPIEQGRNGCSVADVIEILIPRLGEKDAAVIKLQEARQALLTPPEEKKEPKKKKSRNKAKKK